VAASLFHCPCICTPVQIGTCICSIGRCLPCVVYRELCQALGVVQWVTYVDSQTPWSLHSTRAEKITLVWKWEWFTFSPQHHYHFLAIPCVCFIFHSAASMIFLEFKSDCVKSLSKICWWHSSNLRTKILVIWALSLQPRFTEASVEWIIHCFMKLEAFMPSLWSLHWATLFFYRISPPLPNLVSCIYPIRKKWSIVCPNVVTNAGHSGPLCLPGHTSVLSLATLPGQWLGIVHLSSFLTFVLS
jgi:hypothetical protein